MDLWLVGIHTPVLCLQEVQISTDQLLMSILQERISVGRCSDSPTEWAFHSPLPSGLGLRMANTD